MNAWEAVMQVWPLAAGFVAFGATVAGYAVAAEQRRGEMNSRLNVLEVTQELGVERAKEWKEDLTDRLERIENKLDSLSTKR